MKAIHAISVALSIVSLWLAVVKQSLTTPVAAPKPLPTVRTVRVDLLVINRVRNCRDVEHVTLLGFVQTRRECSETWWASYWEIMPLPIPPAVILVDRGWCALNDVHSVTPATCGWALERKGGLTIFARELWLIDSPMDIEVLWRSRSIYRPLGE